MYSLAASWYASWVDAVRQRHSWKLPAAFGVLAAAPLVPLLQDLARSPIPRFAVEGDYAGLEIATRYALTGKTLLGPYSRFGWNHPGPLYFYVIAPIYALLGRSSTGLYAGACMLNVVSAIAVAVTLSLSAPRVEALAALLGLLAWLAAFGSVCVLPWNPLVVVLPLLAFLVLASQVARGRAVAAPFAIFFGMLAAETHLATAPTVIGVSLAAVVAGVVARRHRAPVATGGRGFAAAALVLLLVSLPMWMEQHAAHEGNLAKIIQFFANHKEPPKTFGQALAHWAEATSWLPLRVLDHAWLHAPFPQVMASDEVSDVPAALAVWSVGAWLASAVLSTVVAIRRRYEFALSLLGTGLVGSGIALFAFREVMGKTMYYLLFSATAASTLVWMGVAATCMRVMTEAVNRNGDSERALRRCAAGLALLAAGGATWLTHEWVRVSHWHPRAFPGAEVAYGALLARVARTGETPIVHREGAWYIALLLLNELSRDGVLPRVEARDRWILGAQFRSPTDAPRPLHVYPYVAHENLEIPHCLDALATSEEIELFVSPVDARLCSPR